MAQEKELTFEEVNKHFEKAESELSEFQEGGKGFQAVGAQAVNPAAALQAACRAYRIIRPFLNLASNFPLLPGAWKNAIRVFVRLLNGLCP